MQLEKKRFGRPVLCIFLSAVAIQVVSSGCSHPRAAQNGSPPIVEVTTVIQKDVPIYGNWITTLQGYVNAQIEPHVTGYLIKQ
ncbi:MAG: efflux transporter periplasmic adaptor subunit, partial [Acidobacteriaceae bacterium]